MTRPGWTQADREALLAQVLARIARRVATQGQTLTTEALPDGVRVLVDGVEVYVMPWTHLEAIEHLADMGQAGRWN